MIKQTHINVTIDFTNWNYTVYDLRIPNQLTVKQLLLNLQEALDIRMPRNGRHAMKVTTKQLFIADDDSFIDYPITDGDVITVL